MKTRKAEESCDFREKVVMFLVDKADFKSGKQNSRQGGRKARGMESQ